MSKKNRPFLGLSFGSGFLRGRYPSLTTKSVDVDVVAPLAEDGEDDDRRTLRNVDGAASVANNTVPDDVEKSGPGKGTVPAPSTPALPA